MNTINTNKSFFFREFIGAHELMSMPFAQIFSSSIKKLSMNQDIKRERERKASLFSHDVLSQILCSSMKQS